MLICHVLWLVCARLCINLCIFQFCSRVCICVVIGFVETVSFALVDNSLLKLGFAAVTVVLHYHARFSGSLKQLPKICRNVLFA